MGFGELTVVVIVALVVMGPKELPKVLRKLGQWAGKLRRMASDIRSQSGIDDVLRGEGISEDIAEIRKLARGEIENVTRAARVDTAVRPLRRTEPPAPPPELEQRNSVVIRRDVDVRAVEQPHGEDLRSLRPGPVEP